MRTPVPVISDHGGQLTAACRRFPEAPQPWIDLSTGINPWPYPLPTLAPEVWHRLPDDATLDRLTAAAAGAYGAPSPRHVAAAPGSQALIQLVPRLLAERWGRVGRVAVVGPTYAEHARCWRAAGHTVIAVPAPAANDALPDDGSWDAMVVVNPNNPDGRRLAPALLRDRAASLARRGGWLVVDEAFADLEPDLSVAPDTTHPGLIVLRSFGKAFGLAGVRLGFALAAPTLVGAITDTLGPWAVSGPAMAIATTALADRPWISATRQRLNAAAARLDRVLAETTVGGEALQVVGGTALFRLAQTAAADRVATRLGHSGILVRSFAAYPTWVRFGLPADEAAWQRLVAVLAGGGP